MENVTNYGNMPGSPTVKKLGQILLIDDNEIENEYHADVIMRSGIAESIKSISHSHEALKHLGHCLYTGNNPDLIFLDIMMPRLNGYELLDKYRALMSASNYPEKKIKIFILSGILDDPEIDFHLKSPGYADLVVGYRSKPLTVEILEEVYEEYFGVSSFSDLPQTQKKPRFKPVRYWFSSSEGLVKE